MEDPGPLLTIGDYLYSLPLPIMLAASTIASATTSVSNVSLSGRSITHVAEGR